MTVRDADPFVGGARLIRAALIVAALGLAGFIVGLIVSPMQTLASYLIAYFWAITVVIGLQAFVLAAYIMNAAWPSAVRRVVEMGFATMPLLFALYLPLLWSGGLYPWTHPERIADHHTRELLLHKLPLMNQPFFFARAVVFLAIWTAIAEVLRAGSLRTDLPNPPPLKDRLRAFSSLMLPLLGLTGTFAAFDWVMSLSPDFYSTMFGLYVLSGGFVGALGLVAVMMLAAQSAGFLVSIKRSHWYAIGRLLFAFLIFWAYTGFFQYMLIWIANRPVEAHFYVQRFLATDRWTSTFLVFGHFFVPWLILLSYAVKRHRSTVAFMGGWLLFCHYVDIHWLVGASRGAAPWRWQDLPALLLIGGLCVAWAVWRQRGHLLSAYYDPDYPAGIVYESR